MIKITLLSVMMLIGLVSFVNIELPFVHPDNVRPAQSNPEDAVMQFSFDARVLQYNKLIDESKRGDLKPHQRFMFVPQRQEMHVNGHLMADGRPFMEIQLLEKTERPWIKLAGQPAASRSISSIRMDGSKVSSFDERGEELLSFETGNNEHKQLAEALIQKLDPVKSFRNFLEEGLKNGWDVKDSGQDLIVNYTEHSNEYTLFFDKDTGLPEHSIIKSDHDLTRNIYRYECIDGQYVLVLQITSVINDPQNAGDPQTEFVTHVQLENVSFNQ